jgi:cell wall-associated NlpC family hydrolase
MVVLGVAIGVVSPCHGYAAAKHTVKKGSALTKAKQVTAVGKSKSKLRHASGKTSKTKLTHKMKKRHVKHATMKDRLRSKKAKQARLIARPRPLRSRVARVHDADDEARTVEILAMDLWQVKAYEQELSERTEDRPVDESTLKIIESAQNYLGTPYRYGGTTPEGFDCSGFVRHVFGENGISLNRTSYEQFRQGKAIPLVALRPGDLIFFGKVKRKHCRIEHVGLYIGEGRFIHAASSRTGQVKISELKPSEHRTRRVMARRILEDAP